MTLHPWDIPIPTSSFTLFLVTKNRAKGIPHDRQKDLWRYMTGIAKNLKVNVLALGGMTDHIHTLVALPGTIGHSTVIQKMKENSSKWMGRSSNGKKDSVHSA